MRTRVLAVAAVMVMTSLAALGSSAAATERAAPRPTADYRFSGTLASSVGSAPALRNINASGRNRFRTQTTGRVTRKLLEFPDGNGLRLRGASTVVNRGVYTIAITVRLDQVAGYNRLVNFAGDTADTGLYVYNGAVALYSSALSAPQVLEPNQWATIVLTRSTAGVVRAFIDGVQQFQIDDSSNRYARISTANELWFFRDNPNREESAGGVDRIRLWKVALTPAQVSALRP